MRINNDDFQWRFPILSKKMRFHTPSPLQCNTHWEPKCPICQNRQNGRAWWTCRNAQSDWWMIQLLLSPHTACPVAGAWRWKSSDSIHCIQSIPSIFRFWILFFRKVVCFGIESPLVGFPRFGRDGATPWQLPGMEPSSMTIISSRLQDDITYWMGNLHLLPFSHCA